MLVYLALIAVILSMPLLTSFGGTPRHVVTVSVSLLAIVGVCGLRAVSVGTDTFGYFREYRSFYRRDDELGYSHISRLSHEIGLDFQEFLLLTSLIVTGAVAYAIYRHSAIPWQSFFLHITLGLFVMSMSGIRQSLAVAISVAAITLLMRRREVLFVCLVVLAYTFHNSALILLPFVLVSRVRLSQRNAAIVLSLAAGVATQGSLVARGIEVAGLDKYSVYLEDASAQTNPLVILVSGLIPLACMLLWPKSLNTPSKVLTQSDGGMPIRERADPWRQHSLLYTLAVANFVVVALAGSVPMMSRMTYYFVTFVAILLPNTIVELRDPRVRSIAMGACISLPLAMFLLTTPDSSLGVVPYRFFWSE